MCAKSFLAFALSSLRCARGLKVHAGMCFLKRLMLE